MGLLDHLGDRVALILAPVTGGSTRQDGAAGAARRWRRLVRHRAKKRVGADADRSG
jgi:hypothetical protein